MTKLKYAQDLIKTHNSHADLIAFETMEDAAMRGDKTFQFTSHKRNGR